MAKIINLVILIISSLINLKTMQLKAESTFTISKVSTLRNTFSSERVSSIYFERPQAPITPKSKLNGINPIFLILTSFLKVKSLAVWFE